MDRGLEDWRRDMARAFVVANNMADASMLFVSTLGFALLVGSVSSLVRTVALIAFAATVVLAVATFVINGKILHHTVSTPVERLSPGQWEKAGRVADWAMRAAFLVGVVAATAHTVTGGT